MSESGFDSPHPSRLDLHALRPRVALHLQHRRLLLRLVVPLRVNDRRRHVLHLQVVLVAHRGRALHQGWPMLYIGLVELVELHLSHYFQLFYVIVVATE